MAESWRTPRVDAVRDGGRLQARREPAVPLAVAPDVGDGAEQHQRHQDRLTVDRVGLLAHLPLVQRAEHLLRIDDRLGGPQDAVASAVQVTYEKSCGLTSINPLVWLITSTRRRSVSPS